MKYLWKCFVAAVALAMQAIPALAQAEAPMTAAPVVDSGCCNPCNSGCEDSCRCGHLLADVGFLILKPYWKNNPAMLIDDGIANGTIETKDFTDAQQFVPRLSFGYINGDGFGGRIGWWGFATSQTDFIANPAGDLEIFSAGPLGFVIDDTDGGVAASMALRLNVWDFELIQVFERGRWSYLLSAGIRYAHMSQDYNALEFDDDDRTVDEFLVSGHNFNGAGPTVALQVRGGQNLYATSTVRGALLFGQGQQNALEGEADIAGIVVLDVAESSYDMVLPVAEIELGIGAKRQMSRGVAFIEGGFNAQAWIEAGNASRSSITAEPGENEAAAAQNDPTLGLFGFYLRTGLTY